MKAVAMKAVAMKAVAVGACQSRRCRSSVRHPAGTGPRLGDGKLLAIC